MGYINGEIKILNIKKDGVYYPVGCLTSNSFSEDLESIEGTSSGITNGWTSTRPTNQGYSVSFEGLVSDEVFVDKINYSWLKSLKRGRTLIEWKISDIVTDGEVGSGYITNLDNAANIDEFVSFSGSILGFGIPITLDIAQDYIDRVEADGGTVANKVCLKEYVKSIL